MLFGNAHVKGAIRMRRREFIDASAAGHRRGNRHDARIGVGNFRQRFAKDILIGGWTAAGALVLLAA